MKTFRSIIVALPILFGLGGSVFAEEQAEHQASQGEKQFIISFHENATSTEFGQSVKWITDNGGEILLTMDEEHDKLLLVKMSDHIHELTKEHGDIIESIEEDDWDSEERDEL